MVKAYYNEIDPFAAQWLRNLIAAGHIAAGEVDERSIADVPPGDLAGFTQCHFFAGIGGWSHALRLAGWPDDRSVWTGSCPCQPFSVAGKQQGTSDARHLWPEWFRLIRECAPAILFGEQVAGAIVHGWLDLVQNDLEGIGYAVGAVAVPACSVGAPHIRQRLWFVADAETVGLRQGSADASRGAQRVEAQGAGLGPTDDGGSDLGDSDPTRLEVDGEQSARQECAPVERAGWADLQWLACSDGKTRPTQPGLYPLAHGVSGRVGRLRAYGNAIVPQVAAEFVKARLDCSPW